MTTIQYRIPERESYITIQLKGQLIYPPTDNFYETHPADWLVGLKQYLKDVFLPLAMINYPEAQHQTLINVLLDPINDITWIKCFTHITYDPENNYELLENLGDIAIKMGFSKLIREKVPTLTEGLASQYNNFFLAKKFLSSIGTAFLVDKWVRSIIKVNISMKEDVIESIFGAIMEIGESKMPEGNGYKLCCGLVISLYQDVDFDMAKLRTDKTIYKEIIDKLRWGNISKGVEEKIMLSDGSFQVNIRIPPEGREWLKQYKISFRDDIIGSAKAGIADIALDKAYKQAIETLASKNITFENADNAAKAQERYEKGPFGPYYQKAEERAISEGGIGIGFVKFPQKRKSDELLFSELYLERKIEDKIVKEVLLVAAINSFDSGRFSIQEKDLQKFALKYYVKFGKSSKLINYSEYTNQVGE